MQQPDYTDYWRAALARHAALIAAGCLPMVGAIRAGQQRQDEAEETEDVQDGDE